MARFHLHTIKPDPTHGRMVFFELLQPDSLGGHILLARGCVTAQEFDDRIDRLITQLNAVRNEGKETLDDSGAEADS